MKKIISFLLVLVLCATTVTINASAVGKGTVSSENFFVMPCGKKNIEQIKTILAQENNSASISKKLSVQLKSIDVYLTNIGSIDDIYGIQFSVSANSNDIAFAYITTNLQNGEKPGTSLWYSALKAKDDAYNSAQVLMYGTKAVQEGINKSLNGVTSSKYKIATVYYAVSNSLKQDFNITYTIEDIATKDSNGKVTSSGKEFENSKCTATVVNTENTIFPEILGAQIRVSGKQGIRFGTRVVKSEFFNTCTDIVYGTLIAPTALLDGESILDYKGEVLDCNGKILQNTEEYIIFTGEIINFPSDNRYNDTNFTAIGYVKYRLNPNEEYKTVYTSEIIRNVNAVKSKIGM